MSERMTSADAAFLHREKRTAPQHTGGLAVFVPPTGGFEYDRLVRLLEERISLAPRYRQKVRAVPAHLGNPVWLDDPGFDITCHVRRSALPRPGDDRQLLEFCGRVQSRLLDRSRLAGRLYQLVVTNVPGPQRPLYASGARMTEVFPIVPLAPGQSLSIGLASSYDGGVFYGGVFYGINGDRDAVRDVATIAELIEESLAEFVDATETAAGAVVAVARPHRFPAARPAGSTDPGGSGGGRRARRSGSTGRGRPPTTRGGARGTDES